MQTAHTSKEIAKTARSFWPELSDWKVDKVIAELGESPAYMLDDIAGFTSQQANRVIQQLADERLVTLRRRLDHAQHCLSDIAGMDDFWEGQARRQVETLNAAIAALTEKKNVDRLLK